VTASLPLRSACGRLLWQARKLDDGTGIGQGLGLAGFRGSRRRLALSGGGGGLGLRLRAVPCDVDLWRRRWRPRARRRHRRRVCKNEAKQTLTSIGAYQETELLTLQAKKRNPRTTKWNSKKAREAKEPGGHRPGSSSALIHALSPSHNWPFIPWIWDTKYSICRLAGSPSSTPLSAACCCCGSGDDVRPAPSAAIQEPRNPNVQRCSRRRASDPRTTITIWHSTTPHARRVARSTLAEFSRGHAPCGSSRGREGFPPPAPSSSPGASVRAAPSDNLPNPSSLGTFLLLGSRSMSPISGETVLGYDGELRVRERGGGAEHGGKRGICSTGLAACAIAVGKNILYNL
jgi:hypothetical protein